MNAALFWIAQFFAFISVASLSFAGARWVEGAMAVRRRLGDPTEPTVAPDSRLIKEREVSNNFLNWVQSATLKEGKETSKLRHDLMEAGFESPVAPIYYVIARFLLAIVLPLAFVFSQQFNAKPITGAGLIFVALFLCGVGLLVPSAFLGNRVTARRTQLEQEFPDALDLMVVCVEAGLGIEAAFVRVSEEIKESHPMIADTLYRVAEELRAGRGRSDALRAMSERVGVDSLKSFAALLIQTDALGTSIATTLRSFSNEMRQTRFLKAEEKAMRIPVLMTVPLVACILPVIITALLLPAIIDVLRNLLPAMAGRPPGT